MKLGLDKSLPLAGDVCFAFTLGQKAGSGKAYLGTATPVPVVDRGDVPADNLNAVERHIIAGLCGLNGLLLLRSGTRLLRAEGRREGNQQSYKQQASSGHLSTPMHQLRSKTADPWHG